MASVRAEGVAEVLWELEKADKLATYSEIAHRAGFKAGAGGRAMVTCLKTVRRDWPHLQWWRAVQDDGRLERGSEQERCLRDAGYQLDNADGKDGFVVLTERETCLMVWEAENAPATV